MTSAIPPLSDTSFRIPPVSPAPSSSSRPSATVSEIVRSRVNQELAERMRSVGLPAGRSESFETGRARDVAPGKNQLFALQLGNNVIFSPSVSIGLDTLGNVVDIVSGARLTIAGEQPASTLQLSDEDRRMSPAPSNELSVSGTLSKDIALNQQLSQKTTAFDENGIEVDLDVRLTRTAADRFVLTVTESDSGIVLLENGINFQPEAALDEETTQSGSDIDREQFTQTAERGAVSSLTIQELSVDGLALQDGDTNLTIEQQGGRSDAEIVDFTLGEDGGLMAIYENGDRRIFDRVALAEFDNPEAMANLGNNLVGPTEESGEPKFGVGEPALHTGHLKAGTPRTNQALNSLLNNRDFVARHNTVFQQPKQILGDLIDFMA